MFNFLGMADDYDSRKVDRYEEGDLFVSTAMVMDSSSPFETAVAHPQYNDGKIVIVENYNTKEKAKSGHEKWVKIMTDASLPNTLKDVSDSGIGTLARIVGVDTIFEIQALGQE